MLSWFEEKTVAVIGNAKSLLSTTYGELIDSNDVVVRINRGVSIPNIIACGARTDVLAFSVWSELNKIKTEITCPLKIHMSPKERELSPKDCEFYPLEWRDELIKNTRVNRPSSGLMILDTISYCNPKEVSIFGFDWKSTPTFYNNNHVRTRIHNFPAERDYCKNYFINKLGYKYYDSK